MHSECYIIADSFMYLIIFRLDLIGLLQMTVCNKSTINTKGILTKKSYYWVRINAQALPLSECEKWSGEREKLWVIWTLEGIHKGSTTPPSGLGFIDKNKIAKILYTHCRPTVTPSSGEPFINVNLVYRIK